jgi:hypothetical protein
MFLSALFLVKVQVSGMKKHKFLIATASISNQNQLCALAIFTISNAELYRRVAAVTPTTSGLRLPSSRLKSSYPYFEA